MRFRWWVVRLKVRMVWRQFVEVWAGGFWMLYGDFLWRFPEFRERYYAYQEECWRNAKAALSFHLWLRDGGWEDK